MAEEFDALLHKARSGCKESLGRLLETARVVLLKDASGGLASDLRAKEGASDLVQDTFVEAQRQFASFRGQSKAEWFGWLRRTLEHNLVDAARRYQNVAKRQVKLEVPLHSGDALAEATTPSRLVSCREDFEALEQALDRLPEDYRNVVVWRHRDKLANEEIGERMGRSAEAIRKLWVRAMEVLADELSIKK